MKYLTVLGASTRAAQSGQQIPRKLDSQKQ
jgi:hypothetical protein